MNKVFASVGHFFATVAHGIQKGAKAIAANEPLIAATAQKIEPTVEGITNIFAPVAVPFERMAFQLLGNALAVANEAPAVVDANGINIPLDQQFVNDLKALAPQFVAFAQALGIAKPSGVPTTAPAAK